MVLLYYKSSELTEAIKKYENLPSAFPFIFLGLLEWGSCGGLAAPPVPGQVAPLLPCFLFMVTVTLSSEPWAQLGSAAGHAFRSTWPGGRALSQDPGSPSCRESTFFVWCGLWGRRGLWHRRARCQHLHSDLEVRRITEARPRRSVCSATAIRNLLGCLGGVVTVKPTHMSPLTSLHDVG